ncbi:hypothetical protein O181_093265 [Austropuccinia psidii MF-1]|uniref:Uncharacterized protein n=1 Tax=Austropuccinia psidii MF-1 TaxID=1389203 RepID=A0A9Q3P9X6_9BASI|nr:hypothetical protein [Austropuccinia psidii MF-1]
MDLNTIISIVNRTTTAILHTDQAITLADIQDKDEIDDKHERSGNLPRNHNEGFQRLYKDYFSNDPVYNNQLFRHQFSMQKPLFLKIVSEV